MVSFGVAAADIFGRYVSISVPRSGDEPTGKRLSEALKGASKDDASAYRNAADLYAYWESLPSSPRPRWADINLMDIHRTAPNVFVLDVLRDAGPLDFRFRYLGTRNVDRFGVDVTGQTVRQAFDDPGRTNILDAYAFVVETGQPQQGIRFHAVEGHDYVRFAVLTLPLYDADGTVEKLISATDFLTED